MSTYNPYFHMIDIHKHFHNLFPLLLRTNKENCWKWTFSWLWWTILIPTHLLHKFKP